MLDIPVISTVYLLLDLLKSFFFFFTSIVVFNIQILYTYVLKDLHLTLLVQLSSVQSLSRVRLFATPSIAAHQASLSITNSRSLLKLMSIDLVMPSNHLILCHPCLLLPQ